MPTLLKSFNESVELSELNPSYPNDLDEVVVNYSIFSIRKEDSQNYDLAHLQMNKEHCIEERRKFKIKLYSKCLINEQIVRLIKAMKKKERAVYLLDSGLSYASPCKTQENDLVLDIEILDFYHKEKSRYEMNLYEKIKFALDKKNEGVAFFKSKSYQEALNVFDVASAYLLCDIKKLDAESKDLLISLLLNMSNCLNNLGRYESTIVKAGYVLSELKHHPKAFYYRAIAFCNIPSEQNLKYAEADLKELKQLIPGDDGVKYLEQLIIEKKANFEKSQKSFFKSFFKKEVYNDKPIPIKRVIPAEINPNNPLVYMDLEVGTFDEKPDGEAEYKKYKERIEIELFADVVPKTSENFLLLSNTKKYKGTVFHRLIKNVLIQGGDYENFNGTGGQSIYGGKFEDENFEYYHSCPGLLSMANSGPNTNGSQFFITFKETPWLDTKHVVFGRITKGMDFLLTLNEIEVGNEDRPIRAITVVDCGKIDKDSA